MMLKAVSSRAGLTIFLAGALKDTLLIRVLGDQAVDGDILGLSNAMRTCNSLQIILQQSFTCQQC